MSNPIERDEFDLWAESSEESTRKANEVSRLTLLGNLDRWIDDAFGFIDSEMQGCLVKYLGWSDERFVIRCYKKG